MDKLKYKVRQYRPNYFSGFETQIAEGLTKDQLTTPNWFRNFEHDGFLEFKIEDYGNDELIISAHYKDGKHWVAGFATWERSAMAEDWRYKPHTNSIASEGW